MLQERKAVTSDDGSLSCQVRGFMAVKWQLSQNFYACVCVCVLFQETEEELNELEEYKEAKNMLDSVVLELWFQIRGCPHCEIQLLPTFIPSATPCLTIGKLNPFRVSFLGLIIWIVYCLKCWHVWSYLSCMTKNKSPKKSTLKHQLYFRFYPSWW